MATTSPKLTAQRNLILGSLLVLAGAAWGVLIWQSETNSDGMGLTMGFGASLFLAIWVIMMVAMMFPTAAPMILMFARIQAGKEQQGQPFVPTWLFVSSYLLIWTAFGVLAYLLALGADRLANESMWVLDNAAKLGGIVLIAAGLYQVSPLKRTCLSKCRTPMEFVLTNWKDGYRGAFRMGLEHGSYCLGCCWLLFVILFPLGMMNVAAMALITLFVFAEKSLPLGQQIGVVAAIFLVGYGILVFIEPSTLPTMM